MKSPSRQEIGSLLALCSAGRFPEAVQQASALIQRYPASVAILNILGAIHMNMGQPEQAAATFSEALKLRPDLAQARVGLASAELRLGQLEQAVEHYTSALQLVPGDPEVHNNLGVALRRLGRSREAASSFGRAYQLKPDFAAALSNLALALDDLEQRDQALSCLNKALTISPDYAEAHYNRGLVLNNMDRSAEALESFDQAIRLKPDYAEAYSNRGMVLNFLGRTEEAEQSYRKAIEIRPDFAEAHRSLSTLMQYQPDDPHLKQLQALLERPEQPDEDRMRLSFALAKACDDTGQVDQAFALFRAGNELRKQMLNFELATVREFASKITALFSEDLPVPDADDPDMSASDQRAIFIVGMPRSGTSLVEQILASHSQVFGAGEQRLLERAVGTVDWNSENRSASDFISVRNAFLSGLAKFGAAERVITDKLPFNFWWIGFIMAALPDARVVHVRRDARATCWSNYRHFFPSRTVTFTNDFADLAGYYRIYSDLMAFWHEKYPGRIYDLDYEQLTENQEQETDKLLEYVGLDPEQACLEFFRSNRAVRTLSANQVRQAMYQGSSDDWRRYEAHLGPLVELLDGL